MNMKRILSLALVAVLVLGLAMSGCGNSETPNSSAASTPGNESSSTAPVSSGVASNGGEEKMAEDQTIYVNQELAATFDSTQVQDVPSGTIVNMTQEGWFRYSFDDAGTATVNKAACADYTISDLIGAMASPLPPMTMYTALSARWIPLRPLPTPSSLPALWALPISMPARPPISPPLA